MGKSAVFPIRAIRSRRNSVFHYLLAVLLFLFWVIPAQAASNRIHHRIDPNSTVTIKGHVHPAAIPRNDVGPADPSLPMEYVTILMKPGPGLEHFLAEQKSPGSPNYHRWLTPEQYGERFGLSDSDMNQVVGWLRSQNLRIHDVARGRHWVTFSGTAGQIGKAFRTEIRRYRVGGKIHFANATEPSVPEAFEAVVAGFDRLTDFPEHPAHVKGKPVAADRPAFSAGSSHYLAPDDVATIYNLAPLYAAGIDGTGQKIAVIGSTDISLADIREFRRRFHLPPSDPQIVLVGPDPGVSPSDVDEAHLDIEWAGAAARNATIIYVNSTNVRTSAQYAIDQNLAPVISFSYGSCEQENSPVLRHLAQQANAQGITWVVAAGDWGAATCDANALTLQASKGPTVSWPASAPEVTAIGGTTLNEGEGQYWSNSSDPDGSLALSYIPEKVWNDSGDSTVFGGSSGGGRSAYFAKPYWQTGPGVPSENARAIPDISLAASARHDGYVIQSNGTLLAAGGTSVGAPIFAGVVALLNQFLMSQNFLPSPGLGNINSTLYRMAQATPAAFHDVVEGDNKILCVQSSPGCVDGLMGFSAGPGYDMATGLGSIDAYQLVSNWDKGNSSRTTLTANPAMVSLDGTVELTATVSGVQGIPTGSVTFLANDTQIATVPVQDASGSASATLSVPASVALAGTGIVSALYSGDALNAPSAGSATVSPLPSSSSFVVPSVSPNPVYQATAAGWPFTLTLTERNGVATTLTDFTVGGTSVALPGTGSIPAGGTLTFTLQSSNIPSVPAERVFGFTGLDGDGRQWTRELTVQFVGPAGPLLYPAIAVSSTPKLVQQDLLLDPACQWTHEIVVQEQNGYSVQLTQLSAGGESLTSQIQQIFGTTRLAPYGTLRGTLCWSNLVVPQTKTFKVSGMAAETATSVSAIFAVQYQAAPSATSALSLSKSEISFSLSEGQESASLPVDLSIGDAAKNWTAAVLPGNRTTSWLKISPASGSASTTLHVEASRAGLSNGVYQAEIALESPGSAPQAIRILVTLIVGGSKETIITGAASVATSKPEFAPGILASVFGAGLSPVTQKATSLPLPFQISGVSATVNGISAPLCSVSPGQINLQIPYEVGAGPAVLAVNNSGQIAAFAIRVAMAAPGLIEIRNEQGTPIGSAAPGQALAAYITGEGDVTPMLPSGAPVASGTPAWRQPAPRLPVAVTVGGAKADITFAAIPSSSVGITKISFTVPSSVPAGPQAVIVTVGGIPTQPLSLDITSP